MEPAILRVNKKNIQEAIRLAKEELNKGNIVVLPTGTCYILAADALNPSAIKKVYKIKRRDPLKPLSVIVYGVGMAERVVEIDNRSKAVFKAFLPGPLTIVLPKLSSTPKELTGKYRSLGITSAKQGVCKKVVKSFGNPITATSANPSGGRPPYKIDSILNQFSRKQLRLIDLILNVGKLPKIKPSTILDLTAVPPKILREGPITKKQINKFLSTPA